MATNTLTKTKWNLDPSLAQTLRISCALDDGFKKKGAKNYPLLNPSFRAGKV